MFVLLWRQKACVIHSSWVEIFPGDCTPEYKQFTVVKLLYQLFLLSWNLLYYYGVNMKVQMPKLGK